MAESLLWKLIALIPVLCQVFANDPKGLMVATFPTWFYQAHLEIYHGDPSNYVMNKVPGRVQTDIGDNAQVTSIVSNTKDNTVYFLDATSQTIYTYNNFTFYMNHTHQSFSKIHTGVSATTSQIAYDWLANNIYWTDGFYKWICSHPATTDQDLSLYKVLVKDHLTKPEGITLDPFKRYLFWSDVDQVRARSKIERTNLVGENRKVIVQMDSPIWISSLTVDTDSNTLYWVDMGRQTLEMVDYDGTLSSRKVLSRTLGATFLSMSMGKDVICATEFKYYYVMCFDKMTGNNTWFTSYIDQEVWGISVFDSDLQKQSSHPCQNKNCEHMCFNIDDNNARCECKEGYKIQNDGISCKSEDGLLFGKGFIVANDSDACLFDSHILNNGDQTPHCFLSNLTGVSMFVVDSHYRQFYYVDSTHSKVKVVDMITNREKEVFSDITGQVKISGLALDWTTKNLYWTDSYGGKIVVFSLTTSTLNDNLVTSLEDPSSITIDPHGKKMYWLTGKLANTLDVANLDGTNHYSVIPTGTLNSAHALFYDVHSKRLFYVTGLGDMQSVKTDGTNIAYHPYTGRVTHILVYKEFVLWTASDEYLEMAHRTSYFADVYMDIGYMGIVSAIGIYDKDMQPMEVNNCTNDNGGCQHICQPTATSMKCFCNFGYKLSSDGKTCFNEPFYDEFAIISDVTHDRLYQVGLSDAELRALDIPDVNVPVSVIYDKPTEKLYWSNAVRTEIRAAKLKATTSELIFDTWSTLPVGLAFDYSSGLLYFSTEAWYESSYIACIHPHVGKVKTLMTDLDLPKNIALYPSKGWMFWTDISTSDTTSSYIGKAYMDGTNKKKIVTTDIDAPNGIIIDFSSDRLYWADAGLSKIFSVDMYGNGRMTIIEEPSAGLVGLDISPPYLYYVGRNKQHVSKIELSSMSKLSFMNDVHALGRIESIRVYPEQDQPLSDACKNNGGCGLFCLSIPSGRTCACEDGDNLQADGKTCQQHISCPTSIPNAILADRCIGHATGVCNFTCASGYEKTVDVLKCDDNGNWNQHVHTVCQSLSGTCNAFIPNGHVSTDCDKKINSVCTFKCNAGYVPKNNDASVTCTNSGAWSRPVQDLCITSENYCPASIPDGALASDCTRSAGSQCDYTCNSGFLKNNAVTALVCLSSGQWNFKGVFCQPDSTLRCPTSIPNGAFGNQCTFYTGKYCSYTCNTGYIKNPSIGQLRCQENGKWQFQLQSLCVQAKAKCGKVFSHGNFIEPCSASHGVTCDYQCDDGYVQQPIVQHVTCNDGKWAVDRNQLCIVVEDNPTVSQAQVQEGTSAGAVAGVAISAIVITLLIVLVVVYFVWWRKRPQGQLMADTNLKFKKFDDSHVNIDSGVGGFSNPIAQQPDYGNFSNCREEGYVTAEINPRYQNIDPSDVSVAVEGVPTPAKNGDLQSKA